MENFCKDLRDQAMKIINYEEKKEIILIIEEKESYEKNKNNDENNDGEFKSYHKVRDHSHYSGKYRRAAHNICNLIYKTPKEIPKVFHNGSTYYYHFIIKKLVEEFKGKVDCLGENTENTLLFLYQLKKSSIIIK